MADAATLDLQPAEALDLQPVEAASEPLDLQAVDERALIQEAFAARRASRQAFKERADVFSKPLLNITARDVATVSPILSLLPEKVGQGMAEGIANVASSATTPENIALAGAAMLQPELAGAIFGGVMAKEAGTRLGEASVAFQTGDTKEATRLATEGGAAGLMAVAAPVSPALGRARAGMREAVKGEVPPVLETAKPASETARPSEALDVVPESQPIADVIPPPTATEHAHAFGIRPQGAAELDAAVAKIDQLRQGFRNEFTTTEVKADVTRKLDAADNAARIEGQQVGNSLRLDLPDKLDRSAVTFLVEASGDRALLEEFRTKVEGKNDKAVTAIDHALANYDRLAPIAERVNQFHDQQLHYEQLNGIDPGSVENYVRHVYDMDAMIGRGRPVLLSNPRGGAGVSTSFTKQRSFATYAEAIEAGRKPRTFDIADLVESRIVIGERLVNRQQWARAFHEVLDPVEQRPIVTDLITQPKGTQVAPIGYVQQELMPGIRVAVHEGYADLFNALLGRSQVTANPIGRALLKSEAIVKHGMLAVDTFHAGRMLYKELALARSLGHDKGRSLLEYSNADLSRAVEAGEIPQQAADWALANRADANLLIENGLNVGRVSDALYKDVVSQVPIVGGFTKWVFDKLTRGAMMHSAVVELNRMRKLTDMPDAQLAGLIAENINTYYGNLGRQGVFKSATFQDLARIVALAPQWVEGMARTEAGAAKQLAVDIPREAVQQRRLVVPPLAKGVVTGVAAAFIANQLVNLASRGQFTWDNEEHGHQLDAWIPDATGKSPGFFLSPLSVFAELTHDAIRYYENKGSVMDAISQIISNKESPLMRAATVLKTGEDWQGKKHDGWDRIMEAGKALAPVPIPLQPALPWQRSAPPGSFQRQLFGSAGIKIEPAPSADSQLFSAARRFKESQGIKEQPQPPSEYRDLNNALRKRDWKTARAAYEELIATKPETTVRNHYLDITRQLYTGKRSLEAQFKEQLSDSEALLLDKAREERQALREGFFEMLAQP